MNEEKRAQQRRSVLSAAAALGVVVAAIALFIAGTTGLGHWLSVATFGHGPGELVVMGRPEDAVNPLVWIAIVTCIALVTALNVRSTARAVFNVAIVLALAGAMVYGSCYRSFLGMRGAGGTKVELLYLWPRPNLVLDARGAVFRTETEVPPGDMARGTVECTIITAGGSDLRSSCGAEDAARRFLLSRGARQAR